jgi:hypothetical protein
MEVEGEAVHGGVWRGGGSSVHIEEGHSPRWAGLKWAAIWAAWGGKQRKGFRPGKRFLGPNLRMKVNGL